MYQRFAFPDTNTFLHYPSLEHIDWPRVLGCDLAIIVIAPIVIRELNRHKDVPTSVKTRDRAASALRKLSVWSEQPSPIVIRRSVELRFLTHDPVIDFAAHRLSLHVADDHLLASVVEFLGNESGSDAVIVTEDLGLKLKAGTHGLGKIQLAPEIRLPDELGAEEKRIRQLEEELKRYRDRMPSIKLRFHDREHQMHVALQPPETLASETIESALAEIRKKHAKVEPRRVDNDVNSAFSFFSTSLGTIPPEEIKAYNEELEKYYAQYEQNLHVLQDFDNLQRRTARLDIVAVNNGTSPAKDVDIFMHFPDGFALLDHDHLPNKPAPPQPPRRPKSQFEKLQDAISAPIIPSSLLTLPYAGAPAVRAVTPNVGPLSIRRTKSYDVELGIQEIKHGFIEKLDPMYVIFPSFDDAGSFAIEYALHAANLPDAVQGRLHVIVDRI